jgi:hypothetical protein
MIGVLRDGEDYPMTQTDNLLKRLPNDIGGLPAEPIQHVDLLRPRLRARARLMTGDAAAATIAHESNNRCLAG